MTLLARVASAALAVSLLILLGLGLEASYSPSGWTMLLATAVVLGGLLLVRARRQRGAVVLAGLALLALVVVGRLVRAGSADTRMVTFPRAAGSRWLGRVIDEQDGSLLGARFVALTWSLPPAEKAHLLPAMHHAFVAMREAEGITPSPVVDTLLGREQPGAFDAVVIEPHGRPPRSAVIFLHGYGGSFTLECWLMAEAARTVNAVTVCPSTGFAGRWWTHDGERTFRATLAYVERRSLSRVYLAGLSNGGVGASTLAPRFARSLSGLILIAGVSPEGSTGGLPTLVVHGEGDRNMSPDSARAFAARTGATYAGFDGGHFVMMVRRSEVRDAIAMWLKRSAGP